MTVYSSHFFPTSPAGSANSNVQFSHTKATVGLGLGLPSDVLATSVHAHTGMGLGIFIDCWFLDDHSESEEPTSMSPAMSSPPLLATRRSPRKPLADSPGSEYAPMRTPSPSLRGCASSSDVVSTLPAPSVPTLPSTPSLSAAPFSGGGAGVGLGIDLPGLDALELASSYREAAPAGAKFVGLGLSLPCFDEAELITTLEPQSTHAAGVGIDFSFLDGDDDSELDSESGGSLPSPWSRPKSPVHVSCVVETAPTRAYHSVSFNLDGEFDGECQSSPDGDSPRASPCQKSTLGFDSPFWATYASVHQEVY